MFSVGSGGALTEVAGSPFATGHFPRSVAFSPSGELLATANANDNTASVFSVGSGGALTAVAGSHSRPAASRPRWRSARAGLLAARALACRPMRARCRPATGLLERLAEQHSRHRPPAQCSPCSSISADEIVGRFRNASLSGSDVADDPDGFPRPKR